MANIRVSSLNTVISHTKIEIFTIFTYSCLFKPAWDLAKIKYKSHFVESPEQILHKINEDRGCRASKKTTKAPETWSIKLVHYIYIYIYRVFDVKLILPEEHFLRFKSVFADNILLHIRALFQMPFLLMFNSNMIHKI